MDGKFLLLLGDDEDDLVGVEPDLLFMIDMCLNFEQSPSIATLYWTVPDAAQEIAVALREKGIKVGVYADRKKAQRYFWKTMGLEGLGDKVDLTEISGIGNL